MSQIGVIAHAGSRTRVTSMGGLYDAATLHALVLLSVPLRFAHGGSAICGGAAAPKLHRRMAPRRSRACAREERSTQRTKMTLAGLEPAIFGSEGQRLIH